MPNRASAGASPSATGRLLWSVPLAALLAATCLPGETARPLGDRCESGQCEGDLVCLYGRCRSECLTGEDCADGEACIVGAGGVRVCTLPEEEGCTPESCESGMVCVDGGTCMYPFDPEAELRRALEGHWVGVFYMMGGDGCLCITLREGGTIDPDSSRFVLNSGGSVQNQPLTGHGMPAVDISAAIPTVVIELAIVGAEAHFSGIYDAAADTLEGDFVAPGDGTSYPMTLDRQGTTCADRIDAPAADC